MPNIYLDPGQVNVCNIKLSMHPREKQVKTFHFPDKRWKLGDMEKKNHKRKQIISNYRKKKNCPRVRTSKPNRGKKKMGKG